MTMWNQNIVPKKNYKAMNGFRSSSEHSMFDRSNKNEIQRPKQHFSKSNNLQWYYVQRPDVQKLKSCMKQSQRGRWVYLLMIDYIHIVYYSKNDLRSSIMQLMSGILYFSTILINFQNPKFRRHTQITLRA